MCRNSLTISKIQANYYARSDALGTVVRPTYTQLNQYVAKLNLLNLVGLTSYRHLLRTPAYATGDRVLPPFISVTARLTTVPGVTAFLGEHAGHRAWSKIMECGARLRVWSSRPFCRSSHSPRSGFECAGTRMELCERGGRALLGSVECGQSRRALGKQTQRPFAPVPPM